jgi:hypothetical protein
MNQPEHNEQVALIRLCRAYANQYPELIAIYAIPNGGARTAVTGARLKAEGVKPGIPDLHLPVARGGYHSLYIEMKAGTNKPSVSQLAIMDLLRDCGNQVIVCYSAEEAMVNILVYLKQTG